MKPGSAVEMTGAWKTRKTKPTFSLRFPLPLEIAARFPHSHRAGDCSFLTRKQIPKTQERSPAERAPELHPFRLILGLENANFAPLPALHFCPRLTIPTIGSDVLDLSII
jgi:hypothetical protein